MSDAATFRTWDGKRANKCDHIRCSRAPVLHVEFSTPSAEYGAEVDLCEEHLASLAGQGRSFLVVLGVIQPSGEAERNLRAVAGEHL